MRISYKPLFSVECLHGYFADRVCKALTLRPTAAWARLLRRYQLLFRPSPGGGTVYYCEQAAKDLLRLSRETTPIAFTLTSTDALLDIYTQSDLTAVAPPSETLHYFSNRDGHAADLFGQPRRLLHPPAAPFAQPALPVRTGVFTHRFAEPVHAEALHVVSSFARQQVWSAPASPQEARAWSLDLAGQPCGRYQLMAQGAVALDFYLSEAPAVRQWGVVEVFMGNGGMAAPIPEDDQVIDDEGQPHPRTFTIALASRETIWRYYIVDQPEAASHFVGYEVVGVRKRGSTADASSSADIRFTRQAETAMLHGRPALVFESEHALPLSEIPSEDDYQFTFRANGRSERGGRPVRLPFAQPSATRFDSGPAGARMCSDIFVYL